MPTPQGPLFRFGAISTRSTIRSSTRQTRAADHYSNKPAAGLHFLMFQPTIEILQHCPAGDGRTFPGVTLPVPPHSTHAGINSVLHTTHRQNYLVPPRRHRSFPLAELLI